MRPIFVNHGNNEDKSDSAEHVEPERLIDVLTRSNEKNDDDTMYCEQIDGYMKLDVHENIVSGSEIAELTRYNASRPEDVQNRSKEYINNKKKGQNDKYDITDQTEIAEKNDDHKKFYEQIVEYVRTGPHWNLVDSFEVPGLVKYNTLKPEDEQNRSKEYIDCKKEGQNHSYDITGHIATKQYHILTNSDGENNVLENKSK